VNKILFQFHRACMAFEDYQQRYEYPINQGAPNVFTLPPNGKILRGNVVVDATVTITNAGAAGTPILDGGPVGLIRRILIKASKAAGSAPAYYNGLICDCSPRSLLRFADVVRQGKYVADLFGSTLGGGVAGAYVVYLSIPIYFQDPLLNNGLQTALNMDSRDSNGNPVYSAVQVKVDIAAALTEMFSGSGGTMVVDGMLRWYDERLVLASDTLPMVQEDHELLIQAPQPRLVDPAMPSDGDFLSWLVMCEQGQPGLTLSDAILNHLRVQGSGVEYEAKWQEIRASMIDEGFYDPSTTMVGQFFKDWTHGLYQNSNAAAYLMHHFNVNNPSGAGLDQLRIYTRRKYGTLVNGSLQ
jgi:hypothetical protein